MFRRCELALLLLFVPTVGWAEGEPERLLSAGAQFYLRWDGTAAHQAAYAKTALSKILRGETGTFVADQLRPYRDQPLVRLLDGVAQDGLILGAELRELEPFQGRLIVIFPHAGRQAEPLLGTLRWAAGLAHSAVKETRIMDRSVHSLEQAPLYLAAWVEGSTAVLVASPDRPEEAVKRLVDDQPRLPQQPHFQRLAGVKSFPTAARGFVDVAALRKILRTRVPNAAPVLEALGLDAVDALTMQHGFDEAAMRTRLSLSVPGERRGLLRPSQHKPFTLADLPKMPPDVSGFTAVQLDPGTLFDLVLELNGRLATGQQAAAAKEAIEGVNQKLGVNVREDLLGALGPLWVSYASHAEGIIFLGQTLLVQVKDEAKLRAAVAKLLGGLRQQSRGNFQIRHQRYHGVDVHSVQVSSPGTTFVLAPTIAIHQGWLVVGLFPQPVHGYLLRATGALPAWKPDNEVAATLKRLPAQYRYLAVTDPRAGIRQVLAWGPMMAASAMSAQPGLSIDISALPNAYEVTQHLFPNVTVASDEGTSLTFESVASLHTPPLLNDMDSTIIVSLVAITALGTTAEKKPPARSRGK
jgi:hypothetical protein